MTSDQLILIRSIDLTHTISNTRRTKHGGMHGTGRSTGTGTVTAIILYRTRMQYNVDQEILPHWKERVQQHRQAQKQQKKSSKKEIETCV